MNINPLNVINVHYLDQQHTLVKCASIKVNVLCSQLWQAKMILIQAYSQAVSQHVPQKTNFRNNILDRGIIFLRTRYLVHCIIYCIHVLLEAYRPRCYWAILCYYWWLFKYLIQ